MKDRIKIGVVIRSQEVLKWEYRIIEDLFKSEFAEIRLFIEIKFKDNHVDYINKNYSLIYRIHEALDKQLYKNKFDFNEKINITDLIKETTLLSYNQKDNNSDEDYNGDLLRNIRDNNLDIIINFGDISLNNDFLKLPRYGIWSYDIGDNIIVRNNPPVYWEVVKQMPEISCIVRMAKTGDGNENIIYKTSISTFTKSININRNRIYGLAGLIIPRLIKGLFLFGESYLNQSVTKYKRDVEIIYNKLFTYPGSIEALWNLILLFGSRIYKDIVYQKLITWDLLVKINISDNKFPMALDSFIKIEAPKGKFWADPFVITKGDNHYIFVEEYLFRIKKAHISVLELDNKGNLISSQRIIERQYHMSYPFVFELKGQYYMIPESKGNRTIQLYHCTDFPNKWEFVKNLMEDISATDSTLFYYNDKWWLFTAVDELNNSSVPFNELFLYYADDIFSSEWHSHPMNPIITDIKISRPAGRIFILNNKIYRPSQDCSGTYGKAFNLNQITILNENEYEETHILKVKPKWDEKIIGTHTFNFSDNITALDISPIKRRLIFSFLGSNNTINQKIPVNL